MVAMSQQDKCLIIVKEDGKYAQKIEPNEPVKYAHEEDVVISHNWRRWELRQDAHPLIPVHPDYEVKDGDVVEMVFQKKAYHEILQLWVKIVEEDDISCTGILEGHVRKRWFPKFDLSKIGLYAIPIREKVEEPAGEDDCYTEIVERLVLAPNGAEFTTVQDAADWLKENYTITKK